MRNPNVDVRRCPTCCGYHGDRHVCPDGGAWPMASITPLRAPRSIPGPSLTPERPSPTAVAGFLVAAILVGAVTGTIGAAWLTRRTR